MDESPNFSGGFTTGSEALRQALTKNRPLQEIESILHYAGNEILTVELAEIIIDEFRRRFRYGNDWIVFDETFIKRMLTLIEHDTRVAKVDLEYEDGTRYFLLHCACLDEVPIEILQVLLDLNNTAYEVSGYPYLHEYGNLNPIHFACHAGCSSENIMLLLDRYPNEASRITVDGDYPLHFALRQKWSPASPSVVLRLLELCPQAALVESSEDLRLPLFNAYYSLEILERLLEIHPGALGNDSDDVWTLLSRACKWGPIEVVQFLLYRHPDTAYRLHRGDFLLHDAARECKNHAQVIPFLISRNEHAVMVVNSDGQLPLHLAVCWSRPYRRRHLDTRYVAQLLMDHYEGPEMHHNGANVVDSMGRIPLHCVAASALYDDVIPAIKLLLDEFPEGIRVRDRHDSLPLHIVCATERRGGWSGGQFVTDLHILDRIRVFVDADIFTILETDGRGMTPLQIAFQRSSAWGENPRETMQYLLDKQREAKQLLDDAFQPTITYHGLPDLVVAEIWSFVRTPLWEPTQEQMNAV